MSRSRGDIWKMPDGKMIEVDCGNIVETGILWDGYNYVNQFWVKEGVPVHHPLCGKTHDATGKPWTGGCNACDYLKKPAEVCL